MQRTRTTVSVPVTATAETTSQTTTTSPARALVERVGNETGEDSHNLSQCPESRHSWQECEDTTTPDAIAEARLIHVQKLTKVKEAVIKVVSHPTGRRADTMHDDGARKARCTTRGYEQILLSSAGDEKHLKMMLVEGALKGHVAAIGDCSGAFNQSLLNPDGTEWQVWIEPRPEAEFGPDNMGEAVSAFPGRMGAPRAWDTNSANVLTSSMEMEQSRYDSCLYYRLVPRHEHIEENAGRHINDFLVSRPEPNV